MPDRRKKEALLVSELATLRQKAEAAERLAGEAAIIAEIGRIISSTLNIDEMCDCFADDVKKLIPFEIMIINLIDHNNGTSTIAHFAGTKISGLSKGSAVPLAGTVAEEAVRTQECLIIQGEEIHWKKYLDRFNRLVPSYQAGIRSFLSVPLVSNGKVIATIEYQSSRPNVYSENDLRLAERICSQITDAVVNAQAFKELKHAEEDIRQSKEFADTVFNSINDGISIIDISNFHIIDANHVFLDEVGMKKDDVVGRTCYAVTHRRSDPCAPPDDTCPLRDMLNTGNTNKAEHLHYTADGTRRYKEIIVSPIKDKSGEFFHAVHVARDITERKQVEGALRDSEEESNRLAKEMAIIAEIGRIISSTLDIEEVYERFALEARKLIPLDNLSVTLCNVRENTLRVAYAFGSAISGRDQGDVHALAGTASEEVVRRRKSLLLQSEGTAESSDRLMGRFPGLAPVFQAGLLSIMCIPLAYRDEMIGVLHYRSMKPHAYTERDLRLAERIGEQIAGAMANAQLFTNLKKTEYSLRESEGRFRAIFEQAAVGVAEIEMGTGRYITVNRRFCELVGRTEEELLATDFQTITHPDDRHVHEEKMEQLAVGKISDYGLEKRYLRKDGAIIWANLTISPLWKPGEAPMRSLIVLQDITERKLADEALQQAHAKMALLINSISSILVAISEDGRIVFWNTEAEKQFGIPEKEVLGNSLKSLGIQWDLDMVLDGIARCRRENKPVGLDNLNFLQVNGKEGVLGMRISSTFGERSFGMVTLLQGANITRRKIMEGQLIQAQKLESIGQLSAGIAHEINTPTQYVGDNVRFLQNSFEDLREILMKYEALKEGIKEGRACDDLLGEIEETIREADFEYLIEEIPKAFQQTLEGVERVSRIVQSMKAFSHPGYEEKIAVDINKAIENTVLVARNEWKYVADLTTDLDPSLPLVYGIPGDINQVILNVLVNAAQAVSEAVDGASGGKGKIAISTRRDDSWVEIEISDTGKGIPVEVRPRIFDPFFTTKEVGKGTGQGLAISYAAVVERHHGSITFDTDIGRGTTFIVRLPIKDFMDAGNQET